MVKNDICLGSASKQNDLFSENVPAKKAPMPGMCRIGPVGVLPGFVMQPHLCNLQLKQCHLHLSKEIAAPACSSLIWHHLWLIESILQ